MSLKPMPSVFAVLAGVVLLTGVSQTLFAADLSVRVQDSSGRVISGAAVCAGTPVDHAQFGADYTDVEGRTRFRQLPATELRLIVSKDGFRGELMPLSGVRFDRLLIVTLAEGGLGPECSPPARLAADPSGRSAIHVSALRIDGISGAAYPPEVLLAFELRGEANEYRVSESEDFAGADWQPLAQQPSYRLSQGGGKKTLYLQVRRHTSLADGDLSIASNVASVDVSLGR